MPKHANATQSCISVLDSIPVTIGIGGSRSIWTSSRFAERLWATARSDAVRTRSRRRAHSAGQSAVDDQGCARDVFGFVRGEVECGVCDVP